MLKPAQDNLGKFEFPELWACLTAFTVVALFLGYAETNTGTVAFRIGVT